MDYAKYGKLDTVTQIEDHHHLHLFSNTKGVELAISRMSEEERLSYNTGKQLAKTGGEKLDEEQKKSLDYYHRLHEALDSAGNATELAKWENQIATEDSSFISSLARHRGIFWNDSATAVAKDIQEMSEKDWRNFKEHPEQREALKQMLDSLKGAHVNQDDVNNLMGIFNEKMSVTTYEESKNLGRRSIIDKLDDNQHILGNDRAEALHAISQMSPEEQERYRNNKEFKEEIDQKVFGIFGGTPAMESASRMLDQIQKGQQPEEDIRTKLSAHLSEFSPDRAQAVRDIQQAFKDDPKLQEKILHPSNPEEVELSKDFQRQLHHLFWNVQDYDRYAKSLLETGRLSIEKQIELDKDWTGTDKQSVYKDIVNATEEEKKKIITDLKIRD